MRIVSATKRIVIPGLGSLGQRGGFWWRNRGQASKESLIFTKDAFCTFSLGVRGCVTRSVAYLELSLELARCLWWFDIKMAEGGGSGGAHTAKLKGRKDGGEDMGRMSFSWWIDS